MIMALFETIDLKEYSEQIERQRENLSHSLVFSDDDKIIVNGIYDEQQAICKMRLAVIEENILSDEN